MIPVPAIDILLDWMLYVGIALAVIFFIISLALAAVGRWSSKLFYSSLAGILIGSTASLIYGAFTEGISSGDTYSVLALIIVAGFIVASVIYFAMGKPERGTGYFLAAALAAGFFVSLPAIQAIFGAPVSQSVGACTLEVQMLSSASECRIFWLNCSNYLFSRIRMTPKIKLHGFNYLIKILFSEFIRSSVIY
ncbi:MAG: hypothetical protein QXV35_00645 [Archaeoglobaceae archaeon]